MKIMNFYSGAALIAVALLSCNLPCTTGNGPVAELTISSEDFETIRLQCSANVIIRDRLVGQENKIVLKSQANIAQLMKIKVSGGILIIDSDGCFTTSEPIEVYLNINEVSKIENDGSGNIEGENTLKGDEMEIESNGSGNIDLKVKCNNLEIYHNGSGNVNLSGNANSIWVENNGSGETRAMDVKVSESRVTNNGSGDVTVSVGSKNELNLNGSGNIIYSGKSDNIRITDNGSGDVVDIE